MQAAVAGESRLDGDSRSPGICDGSLWGVLDIRFLFASWSDNTTRRLTGGENFIYRLYTIVALKATIVYNLYSEAGAYHFLGGGSQRVAAELWPGAWKTRPAEGAAAQRLGQNTQSERVYAQGLSERKPGGSRGGCTDRALPHNAKPAESLRRASWSDRPAARPHQCGSWARQ